MLYNQNIHNYYWSISYAVIKATSIILCNQQYVCMWMCVFDVWIELNPEPQRETIQCVGNLSWSSTSLLENYQGYEALHTLSGSRFDNTIVPTSQAHHRDPLSLRPMTRVTVTWGDNGEKLEQSERERERENSWHAFWKGNLKRSVLVSVSYIYIYMHSLESRCIFSPLSFPLLSDCFIIAFITWNSNLVPLLEGPCSSNPCRFECSVFWGFSGIEPTTSGLTVPRSDQLS